MSDTRAIQAFFPPKLIPPLFNDPSRYIVLYGGRGGAKSWSVARALLIRGIEKPLRILCVREFMSSVADSVHKLLCDQIEELGLQYNYTIEKTTIYAQNGTEFRFAGIRNNVSQIKSFEGIQVAWAEESQNISRASWQTLIPTIRRPGSQIIITFNPELSTDETYVRFVVNPPPNSTVVKINFDDNPFFPQVLKDEAEYMRQNDYDGYMNVWQGFPRVFLENAVYGKELRSATTENRITKVPYDPLAPVHTFWDLGWRDSTSIIFAQLIGFEIRIIDFIQASQTTVVDFIRLMQERQYVYGTDWLPHDARAKTLGSQRSIEEIMRAAGRTVRVVPNLKVADGLNAVRTMFGRMWFDEAKCADLIQYLRKYRWDMKRDSNGTAIEGVKPEPVHDETSHAADALRYLALSLKEPPARLAQKKLEIVPRAGGWMG